MGKYLQDHIKAVLFDHDDTLVGTLEAKSAQHKYVAKTLYDKDLSDEEIREHWGKPLTTLMEVLYGVEDLTEAMALVQEIHPQYPKQVFDDTVATLKKLKGLGIKVGVVTATTRFSFEHDMEQIPELSKYIDYSQTQEDTDFHKPDPRVFEPALKWLRTYNIKPSEALYVGDGLQDMKAALAAGLEFIGVGTGIITPEQFEQNGASSIKSIGELIS